MDNRKYNYIALYTLYMTKKMESIRVNILSAKELVEQKNRPAPKFPTVGYKQFEPCGSYQELIEEQESLKEMKDLLSLERVRLLGTMSMAVWHPELEEAEVTLTVGSHWSTVGHSRNQKLYLYPEEALYLLEVGSLTLKFNDLPLSIERAHACLLKPQTHVTRQQYRVFFNLKSKGYKILRHNNSNTLTKYEIDLQVHKLGIKHKDIDNSLKKSEEYHSEKAADSTSDVVLEESLKTTIGDDKETTFQTKHQKELEFADDRAKEMTPPKKRKFEALMDDIKGQKIAERCFPITIEETDSNSQILEKLQLFEPFIVRTPLTTRKILFDYDLYKGKDGIFKKTALQLPSFRIVIAENHDRIPTVGEIQALNHRFQDGVPILYAVVFPDHVVYHKFYNGNLPVLLS